MQNLLFAANPEAQSDADITRSIPLGSIGGTLTYDGEGLKAESTGTPGNNWLETTGSMFHALLSRRLF